MALCKCIQRIIALNERKGNSNSWDCIPGKVSFLLSAAFWTQIFLQSAALSSQVVPSKLFPCWNFWLLFALQHTSWFWTGCLMFIFWTHWHSSFLSSFPQFCTEPLIWFLWVCGRLRVSWVSMNLAPTVHGLSLFHSLHWCPSFQSSNLACFLAIWPVFNPQCWVCSRSSHKELQPTWSWVKWCRFSFLERFTRKG